MIPGRPGVFNELRNIGSGTSAAPDEVEDEYDKRDHEEQVNEAAGDVEGKPTAPKEQKYDGDYEEHTEVSNLPRHVAVPARSLAGVHGINKRLNAPFFCA